MTEELGKGERGKIRGFGSFCVRERKGYTRRNPRTGNIFEVKPKRLPFVEQEKR